MLNSRSWPFDRNTLGPMVRVCLDDPSAEIVDFQERPLPSWSLGETTIGIFRVEGCARGAGGLRPWSLVLKGLLDAGDGLPWRTEAEFYASSRPAELGEPLRAPRVLGVLGGNEGQAWIALEAVPGSKNPDWTPTALATAARGLGRFNGSTLGHPSSGEQPWLRGLGLLRHVEHRDLHVAFIATEELWMNPVVRAHFPFGIRTRLLDLWTRRGELCAALADLPLAYAHGDAHPMNLLPERGQDGAFRAVLVDWGSAGVAPLGIEAQALSAGALATFRAEPEGARALDEAVFESYAEGLRDAGVRLDRARLRLAHAVAASLIWAFPLAGRALRAAVDPDFREAITLRAERSYEALLAHRAGSLEFMLDLVQEAGGLQR